MKRKISMSFIAVFASLIIKGQNISPDPSNQFCPNQETEFTVSLPKEFSSLIEVNGSTITVSPYSVSQDNKSFKFKGKFKDANQKQTFTVKYSDNTTYDFDFPNIKSWAFYSVGADCIKIDPSPKTINAPQCQSAAITLSFNAIKWYTEFTNPVICFGSITDYEYKIPVGWKIGGSTSTGNWISGGTNVSIIPDLNSGAGQYVYIRPATCATNLVNNYPPVQIPITRSAGISITSSVPSYLCGATPTVALTLNNNSGLAGITDYTWNFGSTNNGWQFTNGSSVGTTYSTGTTPNLSLKPICGSAVSNIGASVTNVVNGQTCVTTVSPYTVAITQPNLYINGNTLFCSGTANYDIGGGLPCNSSVNWSISPATFVSLGNTSGSSTSLSFITNGATKLTSSITSCGVTQTQAIAVQGGVPAYTSNFTPFSIGAFNGSQTLSDNQTVPPNTPITFAVGVDPNSNYTKNTFLNTEWQSSLSGTSITPNSGNGCNGCTNNVGVTMQFPCITGVTTTYIQARVQNGCGWSDWFTQPAFRLQVDPAGSNCGNGGGGGSSTIYTISPNPASGMVNISSKTGTSMISSIKTYYSNTGALKKTYTFSPASSSVIISVDLYTSGQYIFQVIGSGGTESQQIVVQN